LIRFTANRHSRPIRQSLCALAILLAAAIAAQAQPAGVIPPLGPAQPLHLPPIVQRELPNGLKLVVLEDHHQPAVWLRLAIGAGSARDPRDRVGLAQMTAGMLDKGTTSRTETQIADTIDGLGASLGAGADPDYLTVSASGLSVYTDNLFDLMSDITLHPIFPTQELERARTLTLSGIVAAMGRPATVADAAIHRLVYGAHPYGNFAEGSATSVKAITRQDLVQFHDRLFVPNNATLFVVGDVTADQAASKAQARFGDWKRGEAPPAVPTPQSTTPAAPGTQIMIVDRPGAAQTEVRVGLLTSGYADPSRPVSRVASAVLGLGQFESRLTVEIRVKRGLTYGAASFFDRKARAGIFEISTFTKNQSTGEVLRIALEEARRLQTEPVPADELQERKEFLNGSFAVSVATTPGILQRLAQAVLYGAGPEDLTTYIPSSSAVTPAQIEEFMRSLPLDRAHVVLVGDASAIEPQVKSMGTVTVIPAGALDLESASLRGQTAAAGESGAPPVALGGSAEGKARLASAIAALGGDAFLSLAQVSLKGEGEITPPGQTMKLPIASATLLFASGGRSRVELNTTFGDVIFGNDGTNKAWLSVLGAVQDGPSGFGDPTDLLRRAVRNNLEAAAIEEPKDQSAGGAAMDGFAVKDEHGVTTTIYLDGRTHLPRRVLTTSGQGGLEILLGDYHATGNVVLPGSMRAFQGGKPFVTLKFTAWTVNRPVDDKLFARPSS
jgi:zinc protease